MLFDTHMHTNFSTDSKMTIDEVVRRCQELKMGVTITEHLDLKYPETEAFTFDVAEYFKKYSSYRNEYLLLGIEIGMREDCLTDNQKIVQNSPFDFVIGSIHVIDNIDIYHESFYRLRTKDEVYNQYFDTMLKCVRCYDDIDSLGHIDYIARYAKFVDPEIYYSDFSERIDEVLRIVADKEKALEINTRRFDNKHTVEALVPIFKRFFELGGRLVTLGSDAHKPQNIGKGIEMAKDLAQYCGLKPVYYKQRLPYYL